MEFEAGLLQFLAAYRRYTKEMSAFATSIVRGYIREGNRVPEGQRENDPQLKATAKKVFGDLETKVGDFTAKFSALPFPEGAEVVRAPPCGWPLTDIYVMRLVYGQFALTFYHQNQGIPNEEQGIQILMHSAIPGSTLRDKASLLLFKPTLPKWEWGEPHRLNIKGDSFGPARTLYNESVDGHVEIDPNRGTGSFWSPALWKSGEEGKLSVSFSYDMRAPSHSIGGVEFKLSTVGAGEVDAFLKYAQNVPAIPAPHK